MREIDKNKNETGVLQNNKEEKVRKHKMDYFKDEIEELIGLGVSTRSAWKIINNKLPDYAKISQASFYKYVNEHIKSYQ